MVHTRRVGLRFALRTISTIKLSLDFFFYLQTFLFVCVSVGWDTEDDTAAILRFDSSLCSIYRILEVVL
jgi:hypothetical protein